MRKRALYLDLPLDGGKLRFQLTVPREIYGPQHDDLAARLHAVFLEWERELRAARQAEAHLVRGAEGLDDEPVERCENGCPDPVTHHDEDGVPLCQGCVDALVKEQSGEVAP